MFAYVIGNCDMHLKNISLLRSADWRQLTLAPAYDIVATAQYDGPSDDLAMGIGGIRAIDRIGADAFEREARAHAPPQLGDRTRNANSHRGTECYRARSIRPTECRSRARNGFCRNRPPRRRIAGGTAFGGLTRSEVAAIPMNTLNADLMGKAELEL